jgi:hypothetical protein
VTRAYAVNQDVVFGDVNLSENSISGEPHNPGAGGWPTIRYFNKETGISGANYMKKTDMSMCDELGPDEPYMEAYVEEAGKTSLCATDGTNCDERSRQFLEKFKTKDEATWEAQVNRLKALEAGDMKTELKDWVKKRKKIISKLISERKSERKSEL